MHTRAVLRLVLTWLGQAQYPPRPVPLLSVSVTLQLSVA